MEARWARASARATGDVTMDPGMFDSFGRLLVLVMVAILLLGVAIGVVGAIVIKAMM